MEWGSLEKLDLQFIIQNGISEYFIAESFRKSYMQTRTACKNREIEFIALTQQHPVVSWHQNHFKRVETATANISKTQTLSLETPKKTAQ